MKKRNYFFIIFTVVCLVIVLQLTGVTTVLFNSINLEETNITSNKLIKHQEKDLDKCYISDGRKFCKIGTFNVKTGEATTQDFSVKHKT